MFTSTKSFPRIAAIFGCSSQASSFRHQPHQGAPKCRNVGELSKYEVEKLQEVAKRHEDDDDWVVVGKTHLFEEWKKNIPLEGSCKPIPFEDILRAVGREKDLKSIVQFENDEQVYSRIFGSSP
jgi:hypothetical protein